MNYDCVKHEISNAIIRTYFGIFHVGKECSKLYESSVCTTTKESKFELNFTFLTELKNIACLPCRVSAGKGRMKENKTQERKRRQTQQTTKTDKKPTGKLGLTARKPSSRV